MVNQKGVDEFVSFYNQSPRTKWFWLVGAGVTFAVTRNRDALWRGLVLSALEYVCGKDFHRDPGPILKSVHATATDKWAPDSHEFWAIIQLLSDVLGGPNEAKAWISNRMRALVHETNDASLLSVIGEFDWPIATTNYDNLLATYLLPNSPEENGWSLLKELKVQELEDWRDKHRRQIIHLHGHHSKPDGLLFTREDYVRHADETFRTLMKEVFRGRPIFIGCGDTLNDPNIKWALEDYFQTHEDFDRRPLILLRKGENIAAHSHAYVVHYGSDYEDLIPFLNAVLRKIRGDQGTPHRSRNNPTPILPTPGWMKNYFGAQKQSFATLRLPDFRFADRDVPLPLDDIYLALSFDLRSALERLEEARSLHRSQIEGDTISNTLETQPDFSPIGDTVDQPGPVNLAQVLQDHQRAVILGDPGTGKTTLAHWLIRQCAMARLAEYNDLVVEAIRVDPMAAQDEPPCRIGPAWFPVLVTIPEYVRERETLGVGSRVRLLRFICQRIVARLQEDGIEVDIKDVEDRLKQEAAEGKLLIVLDGLDESTQDNDRREIVEEAVYLMRLVFNPDGVGLAVTREGTVILSDEPDFTDSLEGIGLRAGNRVLVTSRIAGYKFAPFSIGLAHFRVEPLSRAGAERLLRNMFVTMEQSQPSSEENLRRLHLDLLRKIRNPAPLDLASLISSPVLVSALFTLNLVNDGVLPVDRNGLYKGMTDLFMRREARRLQPDVEVGQAAGALRTLLQKLAFEVFQSPDSTLISEARLFNILRLWNHDEENIHELLARVKDRAIGPLVTKMPGYYGFMHRTFQEYLCAEYLTRTESRFDSLVEYAGMPTWTEPARLAFMIWSIHPHSDEELGNAIEDLRRGSSPGNGFRPIALAISAISESSEANPSLFEPLVQTAIEVLAASVVGWQQPLDDIVAALQRAEKTEAGSLAIEECFASTLEQALEGTDAKSARAAVVARLMVALDLFTPSLIKALFEAHQYDDEKLGWPITDAMLRSVTPDILSTESIETLNEQDLTFPGRAGKLRPFTAASQYFRQHQSQLERLLSDSGWARLLTALLGGQRDYKLGVHSALYDDIATFLQQEDQRREEMLFSLQPSWVNIARKQLLGDNNDLVYSLAVFLDTEGGYIVKYATKLPPAFTETAAIFPVPQWDLICGRLDQPSIVAAHGDVVLEAAVSAEQIPTISGHEIVRTRNLRHRIADAARRALSSLNNDDAAAALTSIPTVYQAPFVDSLASMGAALGEFDPLKSFDLAWSGADSQLTSAAKAVILRERYAASCSLFSDNRRGLRYLWHEKEKDASLGIEMLADLCRAHTQGPHGRSDMPSLPPSYLGQEQFSELIDVFTAIERMPPSLYSLVEESVTLLLKGPNKRQVLAYCPELAAVLHRRTYRARNLVANWQGSAISSLEPTEIQKIIASGDLVWRMRAQIRLLGTLTADERRAEEHSIEAQLSQLPNGILAAQCIELLAERTHYLDVTSLIELALSIPEIKPADAISLRLRLLLLAPEEKQSPLLSDALDILGTIENETLRAELLRLVARHRPTGIDATGAEEAIAKIQDPILRKYALGHNGAVLSMIADTVLKEDEIFGGQKFAPFLVYANLTDALGESTTFQPREQLRDIKQAGDSGAEVDLVRSIVSATLTCPPSLRVVANKALAGFKNTLVYDQLTSLIDASCYGLGPTNVQGVLSALSAEDDELRARAKSIVLPSAQAGRNSTDAAFSVSACGLQTLLQFGSQMLAPPSIQMRLYIRWRLESTLLDSKDIVQALFQIGQGTGRNADISRAVLESFKSMTPEIRALIMDEIQTCSPHLRYVLQILIARNVAFGQSIVDNSGSPFEAALTYTPDPTFLILSIEQVVENLLSPGEPADIIKNMETAHGYSLSQIFSVDNAENREAIERLGKSYFTTNGSREETHEDFVWAAERLLESEDGPARAARLLEFLLNENIHDRNPGEPIRSHLIVLLAAAAERSPARVVSLFEPKAMRQKLVEVALSTNSFPARRAAFILMGHILDKPQRAPTPSEFEALTNVVFDVSYVIDAALNTANRIRTPTTAGLQRMFKVLRGRSAAKASLVGRMLIGMARNNEVPQNIRSAIFREITTFVEAPLSNRPIYFGGLDASMPPSPTIRDQLQAELSASSGGI